MAPLLIPDVAESVLARLSARASAHGCSLEEEARRVLQQALSPEQPAARTPFGDAMRALFAPLGGMELPPPERDQARQPPDFADYAEDAPPSP